MQQQTQQLLDGLRQNSEALIEDGLLLAARHRYSRAYLCFQAAIDEMNKYFSIERTEKVVPINWPAIDVDLLNDNTVLEKDTIIEQALVKLLKDRAFGNEVQTLSEFANAIDSFKRLLAGDEEALVAALDEPLQYMMFDGADHIERVMHERNELRKSVLQVDITNDGYQCPADVITYEHMVEIGMAALANQLMMDY